MATAMSSEKDDDKHVELFCLIWLDANTTETRNTEQKLRSIINYLKKFQDVEQCQQYIEERSKNDRLVIIVSGRLGKEIVPSIHKLRQVISIYVYCGDKKMNEQWSSKFAKVKAVVTQLDELVARIEADHKIQKKVEEPLSIHIFNTSGGKSTTGVNGQFVFSQVLIDCLLRLKSTPTDKSELLNHLKNQYKRNSSELSNLDEFEEDYLSNKALWWYTRESFFYKTLNAALRNQDIHMIFLFRSFIFDIHHQLQRYQSKQPLTVYRSQMISSDELKTLKQSLGQFISINSFLSTSTDYSTAISFLSTSDSLPGLERVLFQIDADPKLVTTKPFAEISKHSYFTNELEVLFMLGSIFRLESINRDDDQIWIIRMSLCSDDEHAFKLVLMHMKQQIESEETNLRTLGKVLCKMGKFNLAEIYFNRLLKELPPNDILHATLCEDLGELASQTGDFDKSIQWHQKSLESKNQNQVSLNRVTNRTNKSSKHIKYKQQAITIAGGNGQGDQLNQLYYPQGIFIDNDTNIYITDLGNDRIVQWKCGETKGQVIAGENGSGNRNDQLNSPRDVIVDKQNNSLIIADGGNRRVTRWSRQNKTNQQILMSDIDCWSLTMDKNGFIYVSDREKNKVIRSKEGETKGTIVAGGNGTGCNLNQLDNPTYIFVDEDCSLYVSDCGNHRVMKWKNDANEGVVVAGGNGKGSSLTQLCYPRGVIVDHLGQIYVADYHNHRVMRWCEGSSEISIVVGGNGAGEQLNQLNSPTGLSFDVEGNLYVSDCLNHRIQKFSIICD